MAVHSAVFAAGDEAERGDELLEAGGAPGAAKGGLIGVVVGILDGAIIVEAPLLGAVEVVEAAVARRAHEEGRRHRPNASSPVVGVAGELAGDVPFVPRPDGAAYDAVGVLGASGGGRQPGGELVVEDALARAVGARVDFDAHERIAREERLAVDSLGALAEPARAKERAVGPHGESSAVSPTGRKAASPRPDRSSMGASSGRPISLRPRKKPAFSAGSLVGTTGLEPVTPSV